MRILITAWRLLSHTGVDLYTRDLAAALHRRGHDVAVFTPFQGRLADELRRTGVSVVSDLSGLTFQPEIIHGQHPPVLLQALKQIPAVPAISLSHSATAAIEMPVVHPRIRRYVAVDDFCLARVLREPGVDPDRTSVILNFVDLARFPPRAPLPPAPRRALVFSNYADRTTHLRAVLEACRRLHLPVDCVGDGVGAVVDDPGALLPRYDLVFAKARCAIEALAVGNAVLLCDSPGLGPLVTSTNFARLRRMNFGAGVLTAPLDPGAIADAVRGYNAADATAVSARTRDEADLEKAADAWLHLYSEVQDEAARNPVRETPADHERLEAGLRRSRIFYRREAVMRRLRQVRSVPLVGIRLYAQLHRLRRALARRDASARPD